MIMINPLTSNISNLLNTAPVTIGTDRLGKPDSRFAEIFNESLHTAGVADHMDKESTLELMMGEADDLSGLLIDMQKAELSLQLALQIRNKVIDAYTEVMRMSV